VSKHVIYTDLAAPPGGPYSQAVVAGGLMFLVGACPVLPDGTWVRGSFAEQARAAFTNLAVGTALVRASHRRRPAHRNTA
jgi:enamine deaminase RidA (YjgF/YER057c/UK114 family)